MYCCHHLVVKTKLKYLPNKQLASKFVQTMIKIPGRNRSNVESQDKWKRNHSQILIKIMDQLFKQSTFKRFTSISGNPKQKWDILPFAIFVECMSVDDGENHVWKEQKDKFFIAQLVERTPPFEQ